MLQFLVKSMMVFSFGYHGNITCDHLLLGNFIRPRYPVQVKCVLEDIIYGNMLDRSNFELKTLLIERPPVDNMVFITEYH